MFLGPSEDEDPQQVGVTAFVGGLPAYVRCQMSMSVG
jgi:hypothetical protein